MFPMPALRRETAGAFAISLCTAFWVVPEQSGLAQAPPHPASAAQVPAQGPAQTSVQTPAQISVQPPAQPAAPAAPAVPATPAPAAAPAGSQPALPSSSKPGPAKSAPPPPSAPGKPKPAATPEPLAKHPAKPEAKETPKPGPGAIDAGQAAASLRTAKLSVISLIDRSVVGKEKHEIGHVIDVLVDAKGEPAALVVDVGGFMGVGNRRIAIAWEQFMLAGRKPGDALQLPFSQAQVKAAPAYNGSEEVTVLQGAIEPAPAKPAVKAPAPPPAKTKPGAAPARTDLGDGPTTPSDGAPPPDPLNPD